MKVVVSYYLAHDLGVIEQCNPAVVGDPPHLPNIWLHQHPTAPPPRAGCYYRSDTTAGVGRVGSSHRGLV